MALVIASMASVFQGCGGGGSSKHAAFETAELRGDQERPIPVQSSGSGVATFTVSENHDQILVDLQTTGLQDVTGAHIHAGALGEAGPIIFSLFDGQSGPFPSPLLVTLTSANLMPHPEVGISTFEDAVTAILNGSAYINVHTQAHPGGEIRGQIGPLTLRTHLTGPQVAPPVDSTAAGNATLQLNSTHDRIAVTLDTVGLASVTDARIRIGSVGENGPVIFELHTPADGVFPSRLRTTLTAANLVEQPAFGINTFPDAVNAILSGNAFIEVNTVGNPDGALRGQLGGLTLGVTLGGGQEVPPVATTATGTALVRIVPAGDRVSLSLDTTGIDTGRGVEIHSGRLGETGAVIFSVVPSETATLPPTMTVTLTSVDLQAQPSAGISTFDEALAALVSGNAFVTVTTLANPDGEIRGQIGVVTLTSTLNGSQEVPPVTTSATGTGTVSSNAFQTGMNVVLNTVGLVGPLDATIHFGPPGDNGPILFTVHHSSTGPLPPTVGVVLTADDLVPQGDVGINTFADAMRALLSGDTYFNVATEAQPFGEIRGQIAPVGP
ncbi:MAG: CHRD domain-containing protein [Planctomycetes bacterium]|nr:CHRD domain-containing protein [Planctomycetota bacterium]MBI3847626.1 CHRD domain-containing protein [Planctomycetota bacterium]